ncbi:hypothetical protein V7S43_000595 [Phytophthora oleae]|uniref:Uncharacterized protein n=1 Tax=Phytophthora oleae TaxID=2107226 RepID=A0ABD3G653_9STRA
MSEPVEQADVVVVTRPELLAHCEPRRRPQQGSKLLVLAGWKTSDDVGEHAAFKNHVAARDIQLVVVGANELAPRVEDDDVAAMGLQAAFVETSSV